MRPAGAGRERAARGAAVPSTQLAVRIAERERDADRGGQQVHQRRAMTARRRPHGSSPGARRRSRRAAPAARHAGSIALASTISRRQPRSSSSEMRVHNRPASATSSGPSQRQRPHAVTERCASASPRCCRPRRVAPAHALARSMPILSSRRSPRWRLGADGRDITAARCSRRRPCSARVLVRDRPFERPCSHPVHAAGARGAIRGVVASDPRTRHPSAHSVRLGLRRTRPSLDAADVSVMARRRQLQTVQQSRCSRSPGPRMVPTNPRRSFAIRTSTGSGTRTACAPEPRVPKDPPVPNPSASANRPTSVAGELSATDCGSSAR